MATAPSGRNRGLSPIAGAWQEYFVSFERRLVGPIPERYAELQQRLRCDAPELTEFRCPADLVAFLHDPGGDLDVKDRIYRNLVAVIQQDRCTAIAWPILWVGMRPGLEAQYRRLQRRYWAAAKTNVLAELFAFRFTALVCGLRLDRVNRMARTLAWSTARDVRYDLDREARHRPAAPRPSNTDAERDEGNGSDECREHCDDRNGASDDGDIADLAPAGNVPITARPVSRRRPAPSCNGPDGPLLYRTLCDQLTELGGDIELIINVKVRGLTYGEAGEFRDCTEEAARKRVDRVLRLLRKRLERDVESRAPRPLRKNRSN